MFLLFCFTGINLTANANGTFHKMSADFMYITKKNAILKVDLIEFPVSNHQLPKAVSYRDSHSPLSNAMDFQNNS